MFYTINTKHFWQKKNERTFIPYWDEDFGKNLIQTISVRFNTDGNIMIETVPANWHCPTNPIAMRRFNKIVDRFATKRFNPLKVRPLRG